MRSTRDTKRTYPFLGISLIYPLIMMYFKVFIMSGDRNSKPDSLLTKKRFMRAIVEYYILNNLNDWRILIDENKGREL